MPKPKKIPAFLVAYSNSDFTNPHEIVLLDDPPDCREQYTHMGVKYSGLETGRHCTTHPDENNRCLRFNHFESNWLHIALRQRALISEIQVSTRWFTGNQVQALSATLEDELTGHRKKVLHRVGLQPDTAHRFPIDPTTATHCYFDLFYEGGIARIHFVGEQTKEQIPQSPNLLKQAKILYVSNDHYGHPKKAVQGCREEKYMIGWESARTGYGEMALFALPRSSPIKEVVVDTYLHRLNPPLTAHLFGANHFSADGAPDDVPSLLDKCPRWKIQFDKGPEVIPDNFQQYMHDAVYLKEPVPDPYSFNIRLHLPAGSMWQPVLPFVCLRPDTFHRFRDLENSGPFNYLLFLHYPNGGIHGLSVVG